MQKIANARILHQTFRNPKARRMKSFFWVVSLLVFLVVFGAGIVPAVRGTDTQYWTNAKAVNDFVRRDFRTPYGSYRIQTNSSTAYEWYCVSQIYADSAMLSCGDTNYLASLTSTYLWMNHLWDAGNSHGGYFAAANIDGSHPGGGKFADDNALAGNVYLDCYETAGGSIRTQFLNSAEAAAAWLMASGQWDNTFGGGFWWDGTKQNKPTQSNGLALQLFLRLYQITGQAVYRDWANSVKNWLDHRMFNPADGLYVWQITTNGTPGGNRSPVEFTYDNAIMIEADVLYYQVFHVSAARTKAQNLAGNLNARLWNDPYGVYAFNTTDPRVNPCWCGWASQSLIKLYQADGDTNWLNYARRNVDYMNAHLRDNQTGGYFTFCNLDGSKVEKRMEGVDQSWMQRVQAMLSQCP
jgi:uncharacterized protein YyaL (SSP411 family)